LGSGLVISVVVTERRGSRMAFKQIGTLASAVLLKAETVRAARNETAATILDGGTPVLGSNVPPMQPGMGCNGMEGGPTLGVEEVSPPAPQPLRVALRLNREGTASNANEKAGAGAPASSDREEQRHGRSPVLRLVMGNRELRGVPREQSSPALASRNSLVLVVDNHSTGSLSRAGALDFRDFAR
jgi:hypothetical protein